MASANPPPLTEAEPDVTIAPFLSGTRADQTMESITSHQPSPKAAENPFADPQEAEAVPSSNSASPNAAHTPLPSVSYPTDAGTTPRANYTLNGTAVRDFSPTMNSDSLTADPKPSGSKSTTSTAPSSYGTGVTLVSSTQGGAITIANTNPFADPAPAQDQISTGTGSGSGNGIGPSTPLPRSTAAPICNHTPSLNNTNYLRVTPSPNTSIGRGPTPPPKSPLRALGSNRWNTVSSIKTHINANLGLHHLAGNRSATSLAREALARESARRQDILLEAERAKHISTSSSQPNLQEPHLRPSPSALRVAAELIRARDASVSYGARAVLTSSAFWVAILGVEVGLVSTSAAIAVIIEAGQRGDKAYVGAGRVFWLVISIVVFVLSGGAAWGIWLRKGRGGGEEGVLRQLGCDEVGLLDRAVVRDVEMGRMDADADARGERGSSTSARQNLRQRRERGNIPTAGSLTSVRTRDPEWQVLYATPKELHQMVSSETLGDTPVRRGAFGLHQSSNRTRRYEEQRANPPRKPASSNPGNLTRSDKSWPLRSSPNAAPFVNIHPEYPSPYQTSSPASDHALLQQQHTSNSPLPKYSSSNNPNNKTCSPLSIPDSAPVTQGPGLDGRTRIESRVEILSPLSSLTQSIQTASQSSLPVLHRPHYIHGHCVASEERVRSLRQSLESRSRGNSGTDTGGTSSRDLSRVQSNKASLTSEMIREYVADLDGGVEEEERVGRRRSRSVDTDVVLAGGFDTRNEHSVVEKGSKTPHQKARDVLANVKGHFHHPRGRSLGSVVREKMARLKEAGVEPDPEPALPLLPTHQPSPPRDREIFIVGGDDSPTNTPTKPPRKSPAKSPAKTPSKIPTARKSPKTSPNKSVLPSSPLSRKD
ncbi:hypothetical protein BKA61DRAFT_580207 [Leptodontidium sp. MPI-SDFR-AT-0119]|nr:hypothetical protein BKA61DRAFT_580207 [Leptodontidium sp. MPI-SDFR-AT-0119]